jgi:hypothetical protein
VQTLGIGLRECASLLKLLCADHTIEAAVKICTFFKYLDVCESLVDQQLSRRAKIIAAAAAAAAAAVVVVVVESRMAHTGST